MELLIERRSATKFELSRNSRSEIYLDAPGGRTLELWVTREQFEAMCTDLFNRMLAPVTNVLKNSGKTTADVTDVIDRKSVV